MGRPLDRRTRARWDALIETEGKALGLDGCRPFIENKLVNDIFYDGTFNGTPCIVKCSSRAPDSILNEAKMNERLYSIDPDVFPKVLSHFETLDGKSAFIVTQKIEGPSFSVLRLRPGGIPPKQADSFAADMLRIAAALKRTGIVHRDINQDNLMLDGDGHLKLIDFQFAVDRNDYRETAFMRRHWKYLYIVFAFSLGLGGATWNDARALRIRAELLPQTERVKCAVAGLVAEEPDARFSIPVPPRIRLRLIVYRASLAVQLFFRRDSVRREVLLKRVECANMLLARRN